VDCAFPWFHGFISRSESVPKLAIENHIRDAPEGLFLIRCSSKEGHFAVSTIRQRKLSNYLMVKNPDGGFSTPAKREEEYAASMSKLAQKVHEVKHCISFPGNSPITPPWEWDQYTGIYCGYPRDPYDECVSPKKYFLNRQDIEDLVRSTRKWSVRTQKHKSARK